MSNEVDFVFIDTRANTGDWKTTYHGKFAGWMHSGEIELRTTKQMVDDIFKKLKPGQKIRSLKIVDHGNNQCQEIGDDNARYSSFMKSELTGMPSQIALQFQRLKGHFAKNGYIWLAGCNVGRAKKLLGAVSRSTGATVFAGTGQQYHPGDVNDGKYIMVMHQRSVSDAQGAIVIIRDTARPGTSTVKSHLASQHRGNGIVPITRHTSHGR
ncbi:MAG: DUF4347 domain-containing protein [Roseibium sp.]|nr:DUF4347 domain-containing protein [Roseibium sp.]